MNKSILVLDENSVIHGLVTSALETEGLTLHHEFNPGRYVERATSVMPDLILIGNSERDPDYDICRSLQAAGSLADVPMVLLASSKQALSAAQLERLNVAGVVRKPFEASDLQQQVSKHLNLVDLIGSAYEYRQSQSTAEEGSNPLANLDVLDDEVLGLLRGNGPVEGAMGADFAEAAGPELTEDTGLPFTEGAPVVDDEVLAETLQPERAFEPIDEEEGPTEPAGPRFDSLETLEGEFPNQTLEMPETEAELDELGAADVLEEESPEEARFEPQGFDQELGAAAEPAPVPLDDIEVELPDASLDAQAMARELDEGDVELFESDLGAGGGQPATGEEVEESIPLSVRRMMELKPVFTMEQEETAEEEVLEPFDFEPAPGEVEAIQEELEQMDEVDLESEPEEVHEQDLQFASEQELDSIEADLEPPGEFDLMADEELAAEPEPSMGPEDMTAEEMPAAEAEPAAPAPEPEPLAAAEEEPEPVAFTEPEPVPETTAAIEPEPMEEPEPVAEAEPAAEPEPFEEPESETVQAVAQTAQEPDDEDEYFVEEYLGDEEIDESQIVATDDDLEQPDLSLEDEAELEELLSEEERLDDLEELDDVEAASLVADEAEGMDEAIELEGEEEELIMSSLEAERQDAEGAPEETLFERNFNALDEERAASLEGEDAWQLEEQDGAFSLADDGEAAADEVINLGPPEPEPMEEVPASALEEIEDEAALEFGEGEPGVFETATEPEEAAAAETAGESEETGLALPEEAEEVELELPEEVAEAAEPALAEAAGEEAGLELPEEAAEVELELPEEAEEAAEPALAEAAGEEEEVWKPKAPPGFVAQPAEDFPEDAVREPFVGPHGEPESPEPPIAPRHTPAEELEDPDTLTRALSSAEEEEERGLVDAVQPHELEDESLEEPLTEEDFAAHPSLSALADDALSAVTPVAPPEAEETDLSELQAAEVGGEELPEEHLLDMELDAEPMEDFEPVTLAAGTDSSADVTRGEVDALLGGGAEAGDEMESILGGELLEEAPAAEADGGDGFDNLFASLREEIAANPEGEHLDDVLRNERIRDRVAALDFALPQHENTFARALGVYDLIDDGEAPSAYPAALAASAETAFPAPAAPAASVAPAAQVPAEQPETAAGMGMHVETLSLLDPDIRAKLGQVLDEIISISVRKAVQEEMPKIMERLSKEA